MAASVDQSMATWVNQSMAASAWQMIRELFNLESKSIPIADQLSI